MDLLVNSLHVLSDETQRLSSESIRQQNTSRALSDNYAKTQSTVQETQRLMEAQQLNQQALECGIASLQQQINEQKNVSYDGTLLWKITDVSQKIG